MKSKWSIFLSILLLILLVACGGNNTETTNAPAENATTAETSDTPAEEPVEEPAAEPVAIEMFYPVAVDAPIAAILQGYVDDFEAANPDVTVELVFSGGYTDVKTAIQTTVEGGGTPPALGVMLATDIYDLANAGIIMPLDDYAANADFMDDFFPAFLANSYFDGQLWSIPFQRSNVLLYYNNDMFAAAGLEAPTSWQELADDAAALTIRDGDTVTQWGMQWSSDWPYWLFQPLAMGMGQNIIGDSDTEVFFDNPAVIEAVQDYIDLSAVYEAMPAGVQASWGSSSADFASGQTAMIMHSSGSLAGILEQANFEVGVMALPGKESGTYATVVGGGNLYIMDGVPQEQKDAAWRFIEFLSNADLAADFSIQTGYIATRESAYETDAMKEYIASVPQAGQAREAMQYAGAEFSIQNLGEVRGIFHDYLQKAFNGEMSAADAMAAAQTESDAALEAFR
ncbi:MAG: ABC transporter substrate-binding protein [Ardenticatenaceae bacterium]|nr:ABC transporter substrate-binding protein [Anaerolineales bacterium]MCB8920266.1 ABC transporter substrate-binding protein [Ardenticatenaceae bacterium]